MKETLSTSDNLTIIPTTELDEWDDPLRPDTEAAVKFHKARHTENTRRAYEAGWKVYTAWCRARFVDPMNPDAGQVAAFLSYEVTPQRDARGAITRPGRKLSTLAARVAAIRHNLREADSDLDPQDKRIQGVLRGMRNSETVSEWQKISQPVAAINLERLERLIDVLDLGDPIALRDRALILTMFSTLLRRSEVVRLRFEDMRPITGPAGALAGLRFPRPKSKTSAGEREEKGPDAAGSLVLPLIRIERAGEKGPIMVPSPLCPVTALQDWQRAFGATTGPLFVGRTLQRDWAASALSGSQVARIIAKRAAEAGIDVDETVDAMGRTERRALQFSGHSPRRGAATAVDAAGVGLVQLMAAGGWKSAQTAARYVDQTQKPEETAAAIVLSGKRKE